MTLTTVFGLSVFCSVLASFLSDVNAQIAASDNSTGFDSNTAKDADMVLLSQRFNQEKFSNYIVGEVENNGTEVADFVQVSASFYDVNDEIVGREFTYTDPRTIAPGTKSPFEIPVVSEAVQSEGVRYEFTLQWTNPDGSKEAKRMIDSFSIAPISGTAEPSQTPVPLLKQPDISTSSIGMPAINVSQNQSEPLLQPKSEEEILVELPNRLIVTDDVQGDNRLPARFTLINGQLNDFLTPGATKGELNSYYPVVRFHLDDPGQLGLVGVRHLLLGSIKSYDSPSDILEESRYYTNIPLNEQVVLEMDQPGLNYFIASVQFANGTSGVYSNIMDNKAFGTKSAAEDFLEFKIDEGNDYNILEDSDIDDIQSDPMFQQIASNIICSDLREYGFQVCQQGPAVSTLNATQLAFTQSIFEDQNGDDDNNRDNVDNNINGGYGCETNLECQLEGNREWAKDHISDFDKLSKEDQESAINDVLNDIDEDYLDEQEAKEKALDEGNQEPAPESEQESEEEQQDDKNQPEESGSNDGGEEDG